MVQEGTEMMHVYLDNAATTKLSEENIRYVSDVICECYGNANSHHSVGDNSRILLEETRNDVAEFINADSSEIIFTPSGSAANTLGIKGYIEKNNYDSVHVLYSPIAHKSIINYVKSIDCATPLKVKKHTGFIDIEYLEKKLCNLKKYMLQPFVVIDYANSEIGTVQNVAPIIRLTHEYGGVVYLDCTAAMPYMKIDVRKLDADMIGFSGHKLNALKGVGVLYRKNGVELSPIIYGSQEYGLVGGTYNIPAIASLRYALLNYDYDIHADYSKRDYILGRIFREIDDCEIIGAVKPGYRIPNNINICFKGVKSDRLIQMLDSNGIQVSSGSACNSGSPLPSYVLKEIGMSDKDALCCIRMSLGGKETYNELDYAVNVLKMCVSHIRNGVV